jgi:hypothetical protein
MNLRRCNLKSCGIFKVIRNIAQVYGRCFVSLTLCFSASAELDAKGIEFPALQSDFSSKSFQLRREGRFQVVELDPKHVLMFGFEGFSPRLIDLATGKVEVRKALSGLRCDDVVVYGATDSTLLLAPTCDCPKKCDAFVFKYDPKSEVLTKGPHRRWRNRIFDMVPLGNSQHLVFLGENVRGRGFLYEDFRNKGNNIKPTWYSGLEEVCLLSEISMEYLDCKSVKKNYSYFETCSGSSGDCLVRNIRGLGHQEDSNNLVRISFEGNKIRDVSEQNGVFKPAIFPHSLGNVWLDSGDYLMIPAGGIEYQYDKVLFVKKSTGEKFYAPSPYRQTYMAIASISDGSIYGFGWRRLPLDENDGRTVFREHLPSAPVGPYSKVGDSGSDYSDWSRLKMLGTTKLEGSQADNVPLTDLDLDYCVRVWTTFAFGKEPELAGTGWLPHRSGKTCPEHPARPCRQVFTHNRDVLVASWARNDSMLTSFDYCRWLN